MSERNIPPWRPWARFGRDVAVQVIGSVVAVGLLALLGYLLTR
ncbi:hypothetical protein OG948_21325 [Embleya sp. NBC_00888]|nr:hypothetical protein OG948_21325 [Embleya sp. NBC_00888]